MEMNNPKSNLIESFSSDKWIHWVPREEIAPIFERTAAGETPFLKITSAGAYNNFGKWLCQVTDIPGDTDFDFGVEYLAENIEYESVSLYVMLSWRSKDGEMLRREYADQLSILEDSWKRLQKRVVSPANAWSLTAELAFKWEEAGAVTWRNPILHQIEKTQHGSKQDSAASQTKRVVKVATTSIISRKDPDKNLEAMLRYIEEAGRAGADIICLTETFYGVFTDIPPVDICQPIPGELTRTIAAKAREVNSYIILSLYEREGKEIYNTAVLIDRKGEIAGKYRKVHLPLSEVEDGVTPGSEYKVFDTDFGKIGILVCWDQAFPEAARVTADKGAEIIFIPTIGDDELQTRARAKDNGVYVVVAGMYGPATSRIINPNGEIIATVESQNPGADEGVCLVDIDLDERYFTYWLSLGPCYSEHRHVYRKERRVDTYK